MKKILYLLLSFTVVGCSGSYIKIDVKSDQKHIPYFSGNPGRNHFSVIVLKDTVAFSWQNEMYGSFGFNSVVGYDSIVFVNDLSGKIFAYNIYTGKRAGQIKYRGTIAVSPMIHKNYIIFAVSEYNNSGSSIYSYDFSRGSERFKYNFTGKVLAEALLIKDQYFFITENGIIHFLDQTGTLLDTEETEHYTHSIPVMNSEYIFWGTDRGTILRYDIKTKSVSGRLKLSDFPLENGVVYNGIYYLMDNQGILYAISLTDFKMLWNLRTGTKSLAAPVHDGFALWITSQDGMILKVNPDSQSIVKTLQLQGYFNTAPLVLANTLIFAAHSGKLLIIDKESLHIRQEIVFDARMKLIPVIFNGYLFVGVDSGLLQAYKVNIIQ